MKKMLLILSLLATTLLLTTGCNTIGGMGKDLSALGHVVSSGAQAVE